MTALCAVGMFASLVRAEEPLRLEEFTIEASPLDAHLPTTTRLDRAELIESHKSELSDVLDLTPGINVRQGGRGEPRLDMRGFDQRAVLFTLDGVPVFEPYNGIVNLDLFPVSMLGSVDLARGPASSLFGPNGMAGTVKMTTLRPGDRPLAEASTIWRNAKFWDTRAAAGIAHGPFSALAGGRWLTSNGFPLSDDFDDRPTSRRRLENGGLRLNSDRDEMNGLVSLGWQFSDAGRAHATFLGSEAEFGIPPSTTEFAPVFRRMNEQQLNHVQAGIDHQVTPRVGVSTAGFYSGYDTGESQYSGPDFQTRWLKTKTDANEVGSIARVTVQPNEQGSLAIGGQVRQAWVDVSDSANGKLSDSHFTTSSTAVEYVHFLTNRVCIVTGLSVDVQAGGGRGTDAEVNPQGGLSVDLGRFGVARGGVARKIRFPTLRELFDPVEGNRDLDAETALVYELGHRFERQRFYVEATLFRSDVDGLIEKDNNADSAVFENLDKAVLQGFEVVGGVSPIDPLRLDLNYTFLDAEARRDSGNYSEVQHKPAHRFNGVLTLRLPYDFAVRLEGIYTSEQVDRFGTNIEIDDAALFNAQLTRRFGTHAEVFVGADNLLDADYEEKLGSPQPGRWEFAGVRLSY